MYYAKVSILKEIKSYVQYEDPYIRTPVTDTLRKLAEEYIFNSYDNCRVTYSEILEGIKVEGMYVIDVRFICYTNFGPKDRREQVYGRIDYLTEEEYIEQGLLGG